ncbi:MAG TPA: HEAT repeat domain-containing protein, partial [Candidatus Polarisedimenticolaceae bacterium]|nr:HEAT repeat domain-containing protein [Candidatus Polarisedimenticolaceae bacterium]
DALVSRILAGQAPDHVRAAAARGALPLPRPVLTRLFVVLLADPDEGVRRTAEASLGALDSAAVRDVLADTDCAAEVLAHFAKRATREEPLAERIVFHPATPPAALITLAAGGSPAVIDLVLTNQERLLRQVGLLDRLMGNPALRPDQRGRILELLDRFSQPAAEEPTSGTDGVDPAEVARLLEVDVGELLSASEIQDGEELAVHEDVAVRTAYQRIITLNTAQKAVLAMKGGREERLILVRDTNRIVAVGVLRNPRLTETEVAAIARMRNVSDEVLRSVGSNREWVKDYAVAAALVQNPRTPPGISTNFVNRLSTKDLKQVCGSRDVPELVRRMAKRTLEVRLQPANSKKR